MGGTGGSRSERCVPGSCVNPSPERVWLPVVAFPNQGVNTLRGNESDSKTALAKPNSMMFPGPWRTPREGLQLQVAGVKERAGKGEEGLG